MTIAQALKAKKRLAEKISALTAAITSGNSRIKGSVVEIEIPAAISQREKLVQELIALKSAINQANRSVQDKIYLQAELKSEIAMYKAMSTVRGPQVLDIYSRRAGQEPDEYEVTLTKAQVDEKIASLQVQLDKVQEELDHHNYIAKIAEPS